MDILCCELSILHKFNRVDDFEFSLEILNTEDLNNILAKIITSCSERFWKNLHFKIDKIITRDIIIDRFRSLMMDVIIIKSNQKEIFTEVFIYQSTTNLHSMILTAENANIVKLKEMYDIGVRLTTIALIISIVLILVNKFIMIEEEPTKVQVVSTDKTVKE